MKTSYDATAFYKELLYILGVAEVATGLRIKNNAAQHSIASLAKDTYKEEQQAVDAIIFWVYKLLFVKSVESFLVQTHKGNDEYRFITPENFTDISHFSLFWDNVLHTPEKERVGKWKNRFWMVPYVGNNPFYQESTIEYPANNDSNAIEILPYAQSALSFPKNKPVNLAAYIVALLQRIVVDVNGVVYAEENQEVIPIEIIESWVERWYGIQQPVLEIQKLCALLFQGKNATQQFSVCDVFGSTGMSASILCNEYLVYVLENKSLLPIHKKDAPILTGNVVNNRLHLHNKAGERVVYHVFAGEGGYKRTVEKQNDIVQAAIFRAKYAFMTKSLYALTPTPVYANVYRLRLWFSLLKHAYYTEESNYEAIHPFVSSFVNIKIGNAFIHKFALETDITEMLQGNLVRTGLYLSALRNFLKTQTETARNEMSVLVSDMQQHFRANMKPLPADLQRIQALYAELYEKENPLLDVAIDDTQAAKRDSHIQQLRNEIAILNDCIDGESAFYDNAFEWRYEFSEVLAADSGRFVGFDAVLCYPDEALVTAILPPNVYLASRYTSYAYFAKAIYYAIECSTRLVASGGACYTLLSADWQDQLHAKNFRKWLATHTHQLISLHDVQLLSIYA